MTVTRQRHLFSLARVCGAVPAAVDDMRISDFVQLVVEIPGFLELEGRRWSTQPALSS